MFTIVQDPTFTHAVPIDVPCDGGHKPETMSVTYAVLPRSVVNDLIAADPSGIELLRRAVRSVGDLADPAGAPVAFTKEVFEHLLDLQYVAVGLMKAYFAGLAKAKPGN